MNQKLIIFAPFHTNFTPSDGSSIRIAGYTKGLNDLNIDFAFFSPNKPEYVPIENYIHCSINRKWTKLIILHNLLFASFWLRWFSFPIRFILLNIKGMHEAVKSTENRLIWTHQEYTLSLFLYFVKQRPFIYDIHGFFDIQREYRTSLNWWKKIWFELYVIQERIVLGLAPFLNVVSEKMKDYVQSKFIPIGQIFLAPDGIPDDLNVYKGIEKNNSFKRENGLSEDEKVILYAGSFKRIGGVTELVREYVNCTELNTKAVLLLVGGGQEEKNIDELLQTSICKERVFRIKYMPHLELIAYMKMADVIVCPDIFGNAYNEMTPHIKLYDAIASGTKVVATNFEVNKELFDEKEFQILYFDYKLSGNFKTILLKALSAKIEDLSILYNEIEGFTYFSRLKKYIQQYGHQLQIKKV